MNGSIIPPLARPCRALAAASLALAASALEGQPIERGPLALRDGQVLAQGRLSLPAESAATVEPGQTEWRLGLLWANTFAWTQDVPGEAPSDRRFLLDGETLSLDEIAALARTLEGS